MNSIAVIGCIYISFVSICITDVHSNWMYLGLVGVPPPLQQQQGEPGTALDDPGALKANAVCEGLTSLSVEQLEVCMKHPNMINPVASGARKGIQECQYQFKNERWNCSTSEDDQDVFGYVLKSGSKETAFIYAVTSAGVVHSVTQTCSSGTSPDCICDTSTQGRNTPEGWKWGGCSDNIDYGIEFARKFIDSPEQLQPHTKHDNKLKHRIQMNLHNNEAGREIVQSLMRSHCRCHGVSGSCELKTCWRTVPPFNDIGDVIKQKYNDAVMLRLSRKSRSKRNKVRTKKEIKKSDLVHVNKSPNFCKYNPNKGIPGTKGRICNVTSDGPDSCNVLCCGRGYVTQVVKIKEKCHCKFVWCCYVKCKTCEKELSMHSCK